MEVGLIAVGVVSAGLDAALQLTTKGIVTKRQYNRSPEQNKEFYLLSVFLGDIIASPQLCHQLAKRRPCEPADFR
ncbi:hypothetical protein EVAR_18215_1 [Eumeta japonica]|uniref:Uncharacterized protein n=1 Tax=Eumeta variegata TaxID=151549 RepID=A0A4C1UJH4_EUMVA|nr:hypothetical protein EVAR_18215_1 [Eumeta japonica]